MKCGKPDKLLQFVHKQYSQQKKQHFILKLIPLKHICI